MNPYPSIEINGRRIAIDMPPYVVAEMSANHNGCMETALKLVEEAKKAGADAIKLQTYTADTITLDCDTEAFQIHGGPWDGKNLYQLYLEAQTPWDWHKPLFDHAGKHGITIFSSPFDNTAVDLLEDLNAPAYKIASFEAIDLPLIQYVAGTGKPMIISTGMADAGEIDEAVEAAREGGCRQLALLHCVSGYPAPPSDYNIRTIPDMINRFNVVVGLSDHTLDSSTAIASVALGASIIEKHFTLSRSSGSPDDSFSMEPKAFSTFCQDSKTAWEALGNVDYGKKSSEKSNIKFRRSLYVVKDLKKGETITPDSIKSVRPGYGASPKYLKNVLGKKVKADIKKNTPLHLKTVEGF